MSTKETEKLLMELGKDPDNEKFKQYLVPENGLQLPDESSKEVWAPAEDQGPAKRGMWPPKNWFSWLFSV